MTYLSFACISVFNRIVAVLEEVRMKELEENGIKEEIVRL